MAAALFATLFLPPEGYWLILDESVVVWLIVIVLKLYVKILSQSIKYMG